MVKNLLSKGGGMGLTPGRGNKILHAAGQLSLRAATDKVLVLKQSAWAAKQVGEAEIGMQHRVESLTEHGSRLSACKQYCKNVTKVIPVIQASWWPKPCGLPDAIQ